jgi:nucleoid-associated protein YgaU
MRATLVMLFFAAAFGIAALWQSRRVEALQRERETAARIQNGELVHGSDGLIEAGWADVVVGRPSGVDAIGESAAEPMPQSAPEPVEQVPATPPAPVALGDFEKVVQSGETLSEIARAHYGTAAHDLVTALARYNGLSDSNALREGQKLRLPPIDQLRP